MSADITGDEFQIDTSEATAQNMAELKALKGCLQFVKGFIQQGKGNYDSAFEFFVETLNSVPMQNTSTSRAAAILTNSII